MSTNRNNRKFCLTPITTGMTPTPARITPSPLPVPISTGSVYSSLASTTSATSGRRGDYNSSARQQQLPTGSSGSAIAKCGHPGHLSPAQLEPLSTDHYRHLLKELCAQVMSGGGDAAKINAQLNEIFVKRLTDVDREAGGDIDLRLVTYQEWVDVLLMINSSIINNMDELETEVAERLELVQQRINANSRETAYLELTKSRNDIAKLIKIIQNGYHHDCWNIKGVQFETLTPAQVLGLDERQCIDEDGTSAHSVQNGEMSARKKLFCNMKALANEVADKHDEIRDLKRQILCMEDEIQNAQRKIQLKDDVIKELRNDLKCTNAKETQRKDTTQRLMFIRRQLIEMEGSNQLFLNECDSGFSSKSEKEKDCQIVEALRKKMVRLSDSTIDMKKRLHDLEMANNDLHIGLKAEKCFGKRNSEMLKELAELLTEITGNEIIYEHIYNSECNLNPFKEAVVKIKKKHEETENRFYETLAERNHEIDELNNQLCAQSSHSERTKAAKRM